MVPFAGWDMPVEYSGITAEHLAVRSAAGLFDVSHMGEIEIAGKDALAAVQHISSNDASRLQVNQAHYAGAHDPERHVRRRHAGLPVCAEPLPAGRQRQQRRQGLRLDRRARQRGRRCRGGQLERSLRAHRHPGAQGQADPAEPDRASISMPSSTTGSPTARSPASAAPSRGPATPARMASRCSCRRRWRRACGTPCSQAGKSDGLDSVRPRRARYAAPGSRDAPLRQRHRRHNDGARSRSELDHRLEEGVVHRPRRAARAEGKRPAAQDRRLCHGRSRHRPARPPRDAGRSRRSAT